MTTTCVGCLMPDPPPPFKESRCRPQHMHAVLCKKSFLVTMMNAKEAGEAVYAQAQAPIPPRQHLPVHRFRDLVFAFAPPRPHIGCPFL
jgi:hypothetical protein